MAIYGYARVSTLRQANEGESLDVQRRQIEGYAHMHGLALDEIIVEEGVCGSIPSSSGPPAARCSPSWRSGDIVISPKLDRLFRSALDALIVVEDMRKRGVGLHLLDLGGDISRQRHVEAVPDHRRRLRRGRARPDPRARQPGEGRPEAARAVSRRHPPFGFRRGDAASSSPSTRSKKRFARWSRYGGRGGRSGPLRAIARRRAPRSAMKACGPPSTRSGAA